ncbi:hypothetical protein RFI_34508, partial [Reticulomyxa filosa]
IYLIVASLQFALVEYLILSRVLNRLAIHYYHYQIKSMSRSQSTRPVNHFINNDEIMIGNANKKRLSIEIKPIDRRNLKRPKPDDDENDRMHDRMQANKKQKTQILQRDLVFVPKQAESKEE